jgi:hypothetical protein
MSDEKDQMLRPAVHRYQAPPESKETRLDKEVAYAVLALVVVVLAILIATGTVPIHPGG